MRRFLLILTASMLAAVGCTESTTLEPDTGITFMAPDTSTSDDTSTPPADGAVDAPVAEGDIGVVCMSDADCEVYCLTEGEGWRDGYCAAFCSDEEPCPSGAACVAAGGGMSLCLDECEPGAATRSCRAGYGCAVSVTLPTPVCVPGCTDDTDCADGRTCNPSDGGSCYNPAAASGDPCTTSRDCLDVESCHSESRRGWPGGMCTARRCDLDANAGCPDGTECVLVGGRSGRCVTSCETVDDCRDAYDCGATADYPDRPVCLPACENNSQCSDGRVCTSEGTCA